MYIIVSNKNCIKHYRGKLRITQQQLADFLNINRIYLSGIETGKVSPTIVQIETISKILKKPAVVIFDLEQP